MWDYNINITHNNLHAKNENSPTRQTMNATLTSVGSKIIDIYIYIYIYTHTKNQVFEVSNLERFWRGSGVDSGEVLEMRIRSKRCVLQGVLMQTFNKPIVCIMFF